MDELKFRVFDIVEWEYLNIPLYISSDGKLYDKTLEDGLYDEIYIIERCTGIKDKDGKLIYQGDIVKTTDTLDSEIIYDNGCFRFDWNGEPLSNWDSNDLKIVGNKHEYKE